MKRIISLIAVISIIGVSILVVLNRQWLEDVYINRTATLQPAAAALGSSLQLTDKGNFLYRASQPEVQASSQFNNSCSSIAREQSIVLGCYNSQRIYIFDVQDDRLKGAKEVTAAHELLHAIYERLPVKEKDRLDQLLEAEAKTITDQRLRDTFAQYERTEPGQVVNELHSILGTEVASLNPELEQHYSRYFKNRQAIVKLAQQYEQVFSDLDTQIKGYDTELKQLKSQIEALEGDLSTSQKQIEAEQVELRQLQNSNQTDSYNAQVPGFNAKVQVYNANLSQLQALVKNYNQLVEKRNAVASTQSNLVKQLDSKYQQFQ